MGAFPFEDQISTFGEIRSVKEAGCGSDVVVFEWSCFEGGVWICFDEDG